MRIVLAIGKTSFYTIIKPFFSLQTLHSLMVKGGESGKYRTNKGSGAASG